MQGFAQKRPKLSKEIQSSGTSGTEGTLKTSLFNSGVTPTFNQISDDQFYETPRRKGTKKTNGTFKKEEGIQSTQECIQRLVEKNQHNYLNNDIRSFEGGFGFEGSDDEKEENEPLFGGSSYNQMQFSYSGMNQFSFAEEADSDKSSVQGKPQKNWENQVNPCLKQSLVSSASFGNFGFSFLDFDENPNKNENNLCEREKRVELLQKNNPSTIFEVKEELEGLTNPLDETNQSVSKNVSKENLEQNSYQSNKKSMEEYQRLRQSIIQELSQMGSDEWDEKKQVNEDFCFNSISGKKKNTDNDTIIDDLSHLIASPPKNLSSQTFDQKCMKLSTNSDKKPLNLTNNALKFAPMNSMKTLFGQRKRSNQQLNPLQKVENDNHQLQNERKTKFQVTKPENKEILNRAIQINKRNAPKDVIIESRVEQIHLQNIDSFNGLKQKNQNKDSTNCTNLNQNQVFCFKNKPFDALNERKNNFSRKVGKQKQKQKDNHKSENCLQSQESGQQSNLEISTNPYQFFSQNIRLDDDKDTKPISLNHSLALNPKPSLFENQRKIISISKKDKQSNKIQIKQAQVQTKPRQKHIPQQKEQNKKANIQQVKKDEDSVNIESIKVNFRNRGISFLNKKQQSTQSKKEEKQQVEILPVKIERKKPSLRLQRRKQQEKPENIQDPNHSKKSTKSQISEIGIDTKGILQKVTNPKQVGKKTNHLQGNVAHLNFNMSKFGLNKERFSRLISSKQKNKQESQIQPNSTENQSSTTHKIQKQIKQPNFKEQQVFKSLKRQEKKIEEKISTLTKENSDTFSTVQKQKPKNLTISKYTFSKKTPNKYNHATKTLQMQEKNSFLQKTSKVSSQQIVNQTNKSLFQSRSEVKQPKTVRQNYMISKQRLPLNQEKYGNQNKRSELSQFSSMSVSSRRSDFAKQIQQLMQMAQIAKQKIYKNKLKSAEFLNKTFTLKSTVDRNLPQDRIRRLAYEKHG